MLGTIHLLGKISESSLHPRLCLPRFRSVLRYKCVTFLVHLLSFILETSHFIFLAPCTIFLFFTKILFISFILTLSFIFTFNVALCIEFWVVSIFSIPRDDIGQVYAPCNSRNDATVENFTFFIYIKKAFENLFWWPKFTPTHCRATIYFFLHFFLIRHDLI